MVAKFAVALCAILCGIDFVASEVATRLCRSQLDCYPDECCAKRFMNPESYCVPRRRRNELCIWDEVGSTMIDGVYDITCPCASNLVCIREEYTSPNGLRTRGNARCRDPTYSPYNSNANSFTTSYGNGYPSSSAGSYGGGNPVNYASSSHGNSYSSSAANSNSNRYAYSYTY